MIELLVSLAVVVLMVVMFSRILIPAQQAVSTGEQAMRGNSAAAAIDRRLRADVANLSRDGFLAIYADSDGNDHIVFTAVGAYESMLDSTVANAARIDWGRTDGSGASDADIVWRRALLLNPGVADEDDEDDDHEELSLASQWEAVAHDTGGDTPAEVIGPYTDEPDDMKANPNTLAEITALWPAIHTQCRELNIDYRTSAAGSWLDGDALWVRGDDTNWPVAVRFRYRVGDSPALPTYETIVKLPQ